MQNGQDCHSVCVQHGLLSCLQKSWVVKPDDTSGMTVQRIIRVSMTCCFFSFSSSSFYDLFSLRNFRLWVMISFFFGISKIVSNALWMFLSSLCLGKINLAHHFDVFYLKTLNKAEHSQWSGRMGALRRVWLMSSLCLPPRSRLRWPRRARRPGSGAAAGEQ